jgi:hypothetical protein
VTTLHAIQASVRCLFMAHLLAKRDRHTQFTANAGIGVDMEQSVPLLWIGIMAADA